jgi:molybdopterin converting factor small subunit
MMTIKICYYAMLCEQARRDTETRQTSAATVSALYAELAHTYQFTMPVESLRAAVNGTIVPMNTALGTGDEITFIPPVAGG